MSQILRYFANKLVDVLMYISVSSLIAWIPYLVVPTLSPGHVFLTVAVAAFVGMIFVFSVWPHIKRSIDKRGKIESTVPVMDAGIKTYMRYDFPFDAFLSQAKENVGIVAVSAETIPHKSDIIKQLVKNGKTVTILCLNPESNLMSILEEQLRWIAQKSSIQNTLGRLCALRTELSQVERDRLQIKTYDRPPIFNMVIVDCNSGNGQILHGAYYYGSDIRYRLVNFWSRKDNEELFDKYREQYFEVLRGAKDYSC